MKDRKLAWGTLIPLFFTLLFQALQYFGAVGAAAGHVVMFGTLTVGVLLISMARVSTKAKVLWVLLLAALLFGIDYWGSRFTAQARAQNPPPSQSVNVNGSGNTAGNVSQNGSGNNAVIGNGNTINNQTSISTSPRISGSLLPASDPTPRVCPGPELPKGVVPKRAVVLVYGGNMSVIDQFPQQVIVDHDIPILTVDRDLHGGVVVTVDIFGADGKIIASIEKNKFAVNPNN